MTADAEIDWMRRIAAGDHQAFQALYDVYEKPLYSFIRRRIGDPHESADLFHEVMMEIWRAAGRFEGRARVSTWIFGIAHNKTIDLLRKRGRREWDELEDETPDGATSAFQKLAALADVKILRECLDRLDPAKRETIALIFSDSFRYREAAESLQVAEGTIKARVHRAILQLRDCVSRRGLTAATAGGRA